MLLNKQGCSIVGSDNVSCVAAPRKSLSNGGIAAAGSRWDAPLWWQGIAGVRVTTGRGGRWRWHTAAALARTRRASAWACPLPRHHRCRRRGRGRVHDRGAGTVLLSMRAGPEVPGLNLSGIHAAICRFCNTLISGTASGKRSDRVKMSRSAADGGRCKRLTVRNQKGLFPCHHRSIAGCPNDFRPPRSPRAQGCVSLTLPGVTVEEYRFASSGNLRRFPELAKRYSSTVTKPLAVRAT